MTIGIDFGTTNCVLATFADGRANAQPIDTPRDAEWATLGFDKVLPSVFGRSASGDALLGWAAKLSETPKLPAVKRLLESGDRLELGGEEYFVEEIASLLFGAIKQGAANHAGLDVRRAVVTVPANSRGLARLRTKICAGMAGIEVPILINEPTAAAMAYGLKSAVDQNVLVVDWGGGTLDVTLLQVAEGVFIEQASKGIAKLGGLDIDKLVFQQLTQDLDSDSWTSSETAAAMIEIEKAKIRLSDVETTSVALPRGQRREITRFRFTEMIRPLIERLLVPVRTVASEGTSLGVPLDVVLLVGGSCKIPAVRDAVANELGKEPLGGVVDPMTAIAEGAAVASAILDGVHDADFFVGTEHALGTVILNPHSGLEFCEIIPRNMKVPAKMSEPFFPVTDFQETVRIQVVEGDPSQPLDHEDNVQLAEWVVELTPRPVGDARIEVEYSYDVSGLLHVVATDAVDDRTLLDADVQAITGHDPRALVGMAERVEGILTATTATVQERPSGSSLELPPAVAISLERARTKVIPFIPDADASRLTGLADALEQAAHAGTCDAELHALDNELQRYSYLY